MLLIEVHYRRYLFKNCNCFKKSLQTKPLIAALFSVFITVFFQTKKQRRYFQFLSPFSKYRKNNGTKFLINYLINNFFKNSLKVLVIDVFFS